MQYLDTGGYFKMDFIPKDRILISKPDTLSVVRREYNLDKPGQMTEAITILNDWVQKQPHFKKKNYTNNYLETTIIVCKGSIERAKSQLDKICTMRTLLPHFFGTFNFKTDFGNLFDSCYSIILPQLTHNNYRVYVAKFHGLPDQASQYLDFFRANIILSEYVRKQDYMNGFIMIADFTEVNLMDYITKLNPIELRQALTIYIEGYGVRIKGIHIISTSKFVDALVAILKQILSHKVASRIHIHKSIDEIQKIIPKEVMPKDYGGDERTLKEIQADWIESLSSVEHMNYIRDMNAATTHETCRQKDKFCEEYAGMPGTFRILSVD